MKFLDSDVKQNNIVYARILLYRTEICIYRYQLFWYQINKYEVPDQNWGQFCVISGLMAVMYSCILFTSTLVPKLGPTLYLKRSFESPCLSKFHWSHAYQLV